MWYLIIFCIAGIFFDFNFVVNNKFFSGKELFNLELIKKAKSFGRSIGLNKTDNFKSFEKDEKFLDTPYFCDKYVLPFSYFDPELRILTKPFICSSNEISYSINILAEAGGSKVTRRILELSEIELIKTVIHEKFHDTVHLPFHLNEAAAMLVEIAGCGLFFQNSKEKIVSNLYDCIRENVTPCFECRDELAQLIIALKFGKISENRFEVERNEILKKYEYENQIQISFNNTYYYYFPLMVRLFGFMNNDLKSFVRFFKNFPFCDVHFTDRIAGFEQTRKREQKAEKFIEDFMK